MARKFEQGRALLIGMGTYQDPSLSVPIAEKDAHDFGMVLQDTTAAAYPPDRVKLLRSNLATRQTILSELQKMAESGRDDVILLFFSGHSTPTPAGDFIFLPYDARRITSRTASDFGGFDPTTLIGASDLIQAIQSIRARRVVLIFNSVPPPDLVVDALLRTGDHRIVLSACRADQKPWYNAAAPNTPFTQRLIESFKGRRGIAYRDGYINILDIFGYVHSRVPKDVKKISDTLDQEPAMSLLESAQPFPVALYRGGRDPKHGTDRPITDLMELRQAARLVKADSTRDLNLSSSPSLVSSERMGDANLGSGTQRNADSIRAGRDAYMGSTINEQQYGGVRTGGNTRINGTVIGGNVGTVNISGKTIDWDTVIYEPHLKRVYDLFADHMQRLAGASSEEDAVKRYVPLRLQATQIQTKGPKEADERPIGTWPDLVNLAANKRILVTGVQGSGKTTLLLHVARQMAGLALQYENMPIPVYLSLRAYRGKGSQMLFKMIVDACGLPDEVVAALWREEKRPLGLLLDGLDEMSASAMDDFRRALGALFNMDQLERHVFVLACRPGSLADDIRQAQPGLYELSLLSLNDRDIQQFLVSYGANWLATLLDSNLREVVQTPELLSALAQVGGNLLRGVLPQNAGQIYQLLIDRHLPAKGKGEYDYWYVKRPILAYLAYEMLLKNETRVECSDTLYSTIAATLERLSHGYNRRRAYLLPDRWSAEGLLAELFSSPVLTQAVEDGNRLEFTKSGYRDYFAAVNLATSEVKLSDIESITSDTHTRWTQVLILLLGLDRKAAELLFARLYASRPIHAVQLWFENNMRTPGEPNAPNLVKEIYSNLLTTFIPTASPPAAFPAAGPGVPGARQQKPVKSVTHLKARLREVGAWTQLSNMPVDALLDAAEEEHPMVTAVAQYALIHAGEWQYQNTALKPLPPLLSLDANGEGSLIFESYGGCNARIGPLTLVEVPNPASVQLKLSIDRLDFDLASVKSSFRILHIPPFLMAAQLFMARKQVDWLELTARSRGIVQMSLTLATKTASRPKLKDLHEEMTLRACRYALLGECLARDLGLPWEPLSVPQCPSWLSDEVNEVYTQLRRIYSRANQLAALDTTDGSAIEQAMQLPSLVEGSARMNWNAVRLSSELNHAEYLLPTVEEPGSTDKAQPQWGKFREIRTALEVDNLVSSFVEGNYFRDFEGLAVPLPPLLNVSSNVVINRAADAEIAGIIVERLTGGAYGWTANVSIKVSRFATSALNGVRVVSYAPSDQRLYPNALEGWASSWEEDLDAILEPIRHQVWEYGGTELGRAFNRVEVEAVKGSDALPDIIERTLKEVGSLAPDILQALAKALLDPGIPVPAVIRLGARRAIKPKAPSKKK